MKKSLLFYKIFMPATLGLTVVSLTFNILSLLLTFDMNIGNIKVSHPLAILFIFFSSLTILAPIVLTILAKDTKIITRTKKGTLFYKISIIVLIAALSALMVFDIVVLIKEIAKVFAVLNQSTDLTFFGALTQHFEISKLLRVVLTIPFVAYLVFEFTENKSKNTFGARAFCNSMAILWCAITPVVFYFFNGSPPITEYMRITYSVAFIFITIFFLYDFKWNYIETSFRAYAPITIASASFSLVLSIASIVAIIARRDCLLITNYWDYVSGTSSFKYGIFDIYSVSLFEIIALLALGIFVLSKAISIFQTVVAVAKSESKGESK